MLRREREKEGKKRKNKKEIKKTKGSREISTSSGVLALHTIKPVQVQSLNSDMVPVSC